MQAIVVAVFPNEVAYFGQFHEVVFHFPAWNLSVGVTCFSGENAFRVEARAFAQAETRQDIALIICRILRYFEAQDDAVFARRDGHIEAFELQCSSVGFHLGVTVILFRPLQFFTGFQRIVAVPVNPGIQIAIRAIEIVGQSIADGNTGFVSGYQRRQELDAIFVIGNSRIALRPTVRGSIQLVIAFGRAVSFGTSLIIGSSVQVGIHGFTQKEVGLNNVARAILGQSGIVIFSRNTRQFAFLRQITKIKGDEPKVETLVDLLVRESTHVVDIQQIG